MPNVSNVELEIIKTILSLFILGMTWLIGQRVLAFWELRKKRKELDILTAVQFQQLYGEFTTVWRLWKVFHFNSLRENKDLNGIEFPPPEAFRWELLKRASAAEGGVESVLVKLSTERALTKDEIKTLGLFRQAYQQLREAIRNNEPINWKADDAEYILFKNLVSMTACIIYSSKQLKHPIPSKAQSQLSGITNIRSKHWKQEVDEIKASSSTKVSENSTDAT
jgi:hypothetical protein